MHSKLYRRSALALALMAVYGASYAMVALTDESLSTINGQDGVVIQTQSTSVALSSLYARDQMGQSSGTAVGGDFRFDTVNVTPINPATTLNSTIKINAGSDGAPTPKPALSIAYAGGPSLTTINQFCLTTVGGSCAAATSATGTTGMSMGSLAFQTPSGVNFTLTTTNGLLNSAGTAAISIDIPEINLYLTQKLFNTATAAIVERNQLIAQTRLNMNFSGSIWVDAKDGFRISTGTTGYIDLNPSAPGQVDGFRVALLQQSTVAANTYSTTNANGIIALGLSGRFVNTDVYIRGTDDTANAGTSGGLGFATAPTTLGATSGVAGAGASVIGSQGIALRIKGELARSPALTASPASSFSFGEAGNNAYGIQLGNFVAFSNVKSGNGTFDSGNITVNQALTNSLSLPLNGTLDSYGLTVNPNFGSTTATNYQHIVQQAGTSLNQQSIVVATRGLQFQALAENARFISSPDVTGVNIPTSTFGQWSINPLLYNVNANLALYGTSGVGIAGGELAANTRERIGFALSASTTGVNASGSATTSIIVVDTSPNANDGGNPYNRYFGLRNIDLLSVSRGSIAINSDRLNIQYDKFFFAFSAQIATGYLPGAKYGIGSSSAPLNNFATSNDVLLSVRAQLQGSGNFDLLVAPTSTLAGNHIGYQGSFSFTGGLFQIVDNTGAKFGLDNFTGTLGVTNSQVDFQKDTVTFQTNLTIGSANNDVNQVFRVRDVDLFTSSGSVSRLGDIVLTGGTAYTKFGITPRSGAFVP